MKHWNPKCPKCGHPAFEHDKAYPMVWTKKMKEPRFSRTGARMSCYGNSGPIKEHCDCNLWATDIAKLILGKRRK